MRVALATPRVARSVDEALEKINGAIVHAAQQRARIVCFPEAYVPGLRGLDFEVPPFADAEQARSLEVVSRQARESQIAVILSMERLTSSGRQIAAVVIGADGTVQGCQTKNQLAPSEDLFYVPGDCRQIFDVDGVTFGIAICHEGFRYPETVRWAAARGARIVFHPHCTGSDLTGVVPSQWCSPTGPYYEKAMMCRGLENTIYFASVNYAFRYQESATSVISPEGECLAFLPYGAEGVLVYDIDLKAATGLLASRYAPQRYVSRSDVTPTIP